MAALENVLVKATAEPAIGIRHFDAVRIDDIRSGRIPMTVSEREFLVGDVDGMEECWHSQAELAALDDETLMDTAYRCWEVERVRTGGG